MASKIVKLIFSIFAGVIMASSFENQRWLLSLLAIALLIRLLENSEPKQRAYLILGFAYTYLAIHLSWMRVLGSDAWLLLTLVSALPWVLLVAIKPNRHSLISLTSFASVIVLIEVVRSYIPFGGFPWGFLAFAQIDGPLVSAARVGGQAFVTFLVVVIAGLLLGLVGKKFVRNVALLVLIALGISIISPASKTETIKLAAVQGNVPRIGLALAEQRQAVLDNHVNETRKFLAQTFAANNEPPKLIIWPESSTDIDPLTNVEARSKISELVAFGKIPILVGATTWGENPAGPRNTGIFWDESGPKEQYIKNQLVPFGEYVPFRAQLTDYIDRLQMVPNDFVPGTELGIFNVDGVIFGDVICFEVAYGNYMRHLVNSGAQFISVQTNNATYGRTDQPEQQFQISRFRAIEHGRSVIVASTSGISGAIDPNGEVLAKTEEFVPAVVTVDLPISEQKTFSDRFPRWVAILCALFLLVRATSAFIRRKVA